MPVKGGEIGHAAGQEPRPEAQPTQLQVLLRQPQQLEEQLQPVGVDHRPAAIAPFQFPLHAGVSNKVRLDFLLFTARVCVAIGVS